MTQFNNPVKTKCWEKFLTHSGCIYKRTTASHHHWKCAGCRRTITFQGAEKEIPRFHILTNLRTMNVSNDAFNDWAAENC